MTRAEIISNLKKYFSIQELVCRHTYNRFADVAWQFLDTEILHTLLVLRRDILAVPLTINDYHRGGKITQRGLRCNICQLVRDKTIANSLYLSAHGNGAAFDIIPSGLTAEEARLRIKAKSDMLPYPVRLERDVAWLHIDCYDTGAGKVTTFRG